MISGRPLGMVAFIAWLITVSIGVYMLYTWIARGGLRHQRATGVGVPPAVVFGHAGAALTGLAVWLSYLASGWRPLAWAGVGLVGIAITLGICTVTLWTPYPIRASEQEETVAVVTGPAAGLGEPAQTFRVTDEMIARLLAEPIKMRRRRRLQLFPLIPACHGFAAIATFMLALLTAASPR
jgi:hypothetical protein